MGWRKGTNSHSTKPWKSVLKKANTFNDSYLKNIEAWTKDSYQFDVLIVYKERSSCQMLWEPAAYGWKEFHDIQDLRCGAAGETPDGPF